MVQERYPNIQIRSKNELAKQISSFKLPVSDAMALIQDALDNFDNYWHDHPKQSEPEKDKWVRDASGTKLSKIHKLINARVLKPHDKKLPYFIFGGISGKNHKSAAFHLLGNKRKRVLLKLDIKRFYEQISEARVRQFFIQKCHCSEKGAKLLASLCCVPIGQKGTGGVYKTIGRGFAPSSRLAAWCNLDTFTKLEKLVKKELRGKDPRIAIYVDDIGITASRATNEEMIELYNKIKPILMSDKNQTLPLNDSKTKIIHHSGEMYDINRKFLKRKGFEILGIQMNRNSLTPGTKTRWKLVNLKKEIEKRKSDSKNLKIRCKSVLRYKKYIEKDEAKV